jgi:hypothetical protein
MEEEIELIICILLKTNYRKIIKIRGMENLISHGKRLDSKFKKEFWIYLLSQFLIWMGIFAIISYLFTYL